MMRIRRVEEPVKTRELVLQLQSRQVLGDESTIDEDKWAKGERGC